MFETFVSLWDMFAGYAGIGIGGATVIGLLWFTGALSIIGPVLKVAAAFLSPFAEMVADQLAHALKWAINSVMTGLKISLSNIAAFVVIYPLLFALGGTYVASFSAVEKHALKKELQHVKSENEGYRKKLKTSPRGGENGKADEPKFSPFRIPGF